MGLEEVINKIAEQVAATTGGTTSANISYLPGGFTTMGKYMKSLSSMKPHWNIKVLEDKENFQVMFEDQMTIIVPRTVWDEFTSQVLKTKPPLPSVISLESYLREAKEKDLSKMIKDLEGKLMQTVAESPIIEADINLSIWSNLYGVGQYITPKSVLLKFEQLENDIEVLYKKLQKDYSDAIGHLQMLVNALGNKRPLGSFKVFKNYDYLVGSIARSTYQDVEMTFETMVDMSFKNSERITVLNSPELLDELENYKSVVKISGSVLYPVGNLFREDFLRKTLKDTIGGLVLL